MPEPLDIEGEFDSLRCALMERGLSDASASVLAEEILERRRLAIIQAQCQREREILDLLLNDAVSAAEIQSRAWALALLVKHPNGPRSISEFAFWLDCSRTKVRKLAKQASEKTGIPNVYAEKTHSDVPGETTGSEA